MVGHARTLRSYNPSLCHFSISIWLTYPAVLEGDRVMNIITDILILTLPVKHVLRLHMKRARKPQVLGAFALGGMRVQRFFYIHLNFWHITAFAFSELLEAATSARPQSQTKHVRNCIERKQGEKQCCYRDCGAWRDLVSSWDFCWKYQRLPSSLPHLWGMKLQFSDISYLWGMKLHFSVGSPIRLYPLA